MRTTVILIFLDSYTDLGADEPSIANNWHAMTHGQLKQHDFDLSSTFDTLSALLHLAAYRRRPDPRVIASSSMMKSLHTKVSEIFGVARLLKDMAYEGVLSANLEGIIVPDWWAFEPGWMDDGSEFGGGGSGGRDRDKEKRKGLEVMWCTGLGLRYIVKGKEGAGGETRMEILVKPQVLLSSAL